MGLLRSLGLVPMLYLAALLPALIGRVLFRTTPWRALPLLLLFVGIAFTARWYGFFWLVAALPPVSFYFIAVRNKWPLWETLLGTIAAGIVGALLAVTFAQLAMGKRLAEAAAEALSARLDIAPEGLMEALLSPMRTMLGMEPNATSLPLTAESLVQIGLLLYAMSFAPMTLSGTLTEASRQLLNTLPTAFSDSIVICTPSWILSYGALGAVLLLLLAPREGQRRFSDWMLPGRMQTGMLFLYIFMQFFAASSPVLFTVSSVLVKLIYIAASIQGAALIVFFMEERKWPRFFRVVLPVICYCVYPFSMMLLIAGLIDPRKQLRSWTERRKRTDDSK